MSLKLQSPSADLAGLRVLVIEDESLIAMLLQDLLGELHCEVIAIASRILDAAEKVKTLAFDVAILDVNLNGEHTFPIAGLLLDRRIPFVFATGYGAASFPNSLQGVPILQKPFHQRNLERAIREALDAKARGQARENGT